MKGFTTKGQKVLDAIKEIEGEALKVKKQVTNSNFKVDWKRFSILMCDLYRHYAYGSSEIHQEAMAVMISTGTPPKGLKDIYQGNSGFRIQAFMQPEFKEHSKNFEKIMADIGKDAAKTYGKGMGVCDKEALKVKIAESKEVNKIFDSLVNTVFVN